MELRNVLRACWMPLSERAARAYVAGPHLADALGACRQFAGLGFASTVGFWNADDERPRQVANACLDVLDALPGQRFHGYLSVKAPALGFSRDLLTEILDRSRPLGIAVHFDSLGPETVDPTFALIGGAMPQSPWLGCTLPGRWRRSLADADRAVELGLQVRVVKGEQEDRGAPEMELRAGFLAVVNRLAGRARHVAVATHDAGLASEALARLRSAGTPCELELLFGLPLRRPVRVARAAGARIRVYVPYGHAWLPYRISQARQNPALLWWAARDLLLGHLFRVPGGFPSVAGFRMGSKLHRVALRPSTVALHEEER